MTLLPLRTGTDFREYVVDLSVFAASEAATVASIDRTVDAIGSSLFSTALAWVRSRTHEAWPSAVTTGGFSPSLHRPSCRPPVATIPIEPSKIPRWAWERQRRNVARGRTGRTIAPTLLEKSARTPRALVMRREQSVEIWHPL
jgi:hypothetical protein